MADLETLKYLDACKTMLTEYIMAAQKLYDDYVDKINEELGKVSIAGNYTIPDKRLLDELLFKKDELNARIQDLNVLSSKIDESKNNNENDVREIAHDVLFGKEIQPGYNASKANHKDFADMVRSYEICRLQIEFDKRRKNLSLLESLGMNDAFSDYTSHPLKSASVRSRCASIINSKYNKGQITEADMDKLNNALNDICSQNDRLLSVFKDNRQLKTRREK